MFSNDIGRYFKIPDVFSEINLFWEALQIQGYFLKSMATISIKKEKPHSAFIKC